MSLPFSVLPTDRRFDTSPDAGDPECLCSRCGKPIEERALPIRAWPPNAEYEYRFHPKCLGFENFDPVEVDGFDDYEDLG
jgi:hypothetical protein